MFDSRDYLLKVLRGRLMAYYDEGRTLAVMGDDAIGHVRELLQTVGHSRADAEVQYAVGSIYWARFEADKGADDFAEAVDRFRLVDSAHTHLIPARAMQVIREVP